MSFPVNFVENFQNDFLTAHLPVDSFNLLPEYVDTGATYLLQSFVEDSRIFIKTNFPPGRPFFEDLFLSNFYQSFFR